MLHEIKTDMNVSVASHKRILLSPCIWYACSQICISRASALEKIAIATHLPRCSGTGRSATGGAGCCHPAHKLMITERSFHARPATLKPLLWSVCIHAMPQWCIWNSCEYASRLKFHLLTSRRSRTDYSFQFATNLDPHMHVCIDPSRHQSPCCRACPNLYRNETFQKNW